MLRQTVRETEDWCNWGHHLWQPTTLGTEKRNHYGLDLFDDWNVSRRLEPWVKGPGDLEKLRYIIRPVEGHVLDVLGKSKAFWGAVITFVGGFLLMIYSVSP